MTHGRRWWLLLGLLGALALAPRAAEAQEFDLGAGADYWTQSPGLGIFSFGLDTLWRVAPGIQLGFKPGFFITTSSEIPAGIPLDFKVRVNVSQVYVDGFVGPWFFFKGDVARIHIGMGAGPAPGAIARRRRGLVPQQRSDVRRPYRLPALSGVAWHTRASGESRLRPRRPGRLYPARDASRRDGPSHTGGGSEGRA